MRISQNREFHSEPGATARHPSSRWTDLGARGHVNDAPDDVSAIPSIETVRRMGKDDSIPEGSISGGSSFGGHPSVTTPLHRAQMPRPPRRSWAAAWDPVTAGRPAVGVVRDLG